MHARVIKVITIICITVALLFGAFVMDVLTYEYDYPHGMYKHIVVLTGGRNRLSHMMSLSKSHTPDCIFISGVNEHVTLKHIFGNTHLIPQIILGKRANNTQENAYEINEWVTKNKIHSIVLVTSDYHMRRSILELRHVNSHLDIYPCAVKSPFSWNFIHSCIKEFYKVIYVIIRNIEH